MFLFSKAYVLKFSLHCDDIWEVVASRESIALMNGVSTLVSTPELSSLLSCMRHGEKVTPTNQDLT